MKFYSPRQGGDYYMYIPFHKKIDPTLIRLTSRETEYMYRIRNRQKSKKKEDVEYSWTCLEWVRVWQSIYGCVG